MVDRLAAILALIQYDSIAANKALLLGDLLRRVQDMHLIARIGQRCQAGDLVPGRDHDVGRRLRVDVAKGDDVLVLVNDGRRDFALDDLGEQRRHQAKATRNRPETAGLKVDPRPDLGDAASRHPLDRRDLLHIVKAAVSVAVLKNLLGGRGSDSRKCLQFHLGC